MNRNARRKAVAQKRAPQLEPLNEEDRALASMFDGGPAAAHLRLETPTEYAQRRARENDERARALDFQARDCGLLR